jgi:antitoxin ParD1/3/4
MPLMTSVALSPHYEDFIKRQIESGRYNNASEVVRAGLRMLEDYEASRERWLKEEIPARLREIDADPSIGIPAEQVFDELKARHRARLAKSR